MNDKLARFAGWNVMNGRSKVGRGGASMNALVSVTKTTEKKGRCIVRISLHNRAVKQLVWQIGDRICMRVTCEGAIVLSRDKENGSSLCKATGKSGRSYVRFAVIPNFYDAITEGEGQEVEIENGCVAFLL